MPPLTIDLLRRHVGAAFLERGLLDLQAGRVSLNEQGGAAISGLVEGGRNLRFTAEITVTGGDGEAMIDSLCTCPQGAACRHVAAVGLAALGDQPEVATLAAASHGRERNRRFADWERGLAAAIQAEAIPFEPPPQWEAPAPQPVAEAPCYLLLSVAEGKVRLRVVREVTPGGPRRPLPFHQLSRMRLGQTDPFGHYLLSVVGALRGWGIHNHLELEAGTAGWLATHALATGRLLFDDPDAAAVTPGPSRTHGVALVEEDDGYRFCLTPPPDGFDPKAPAGWPYATGQETTPLSGLLPLPTEPPLYLDRTANQLGLLLTPVPPLALVYLTASPPLSLEEAIRFTQRWGGRAWHAAGRFPPPVSDTTPWAQGEAPIPVLLLEERPSDRPGELMPQVEATLSFRYGDAAPVVYASAAAPRLVRDGETVRLHRQRAYEEEMANLLHDGGWLEECRHDEVRFIQRDIGAHVRFSQVHLPELEADGWVVESRLTTLKVSREQAEVRGAVHTRAAGFDLDLAVGLGDERLDLTPLLAGYREGEEVGRNRRGELFSLPAEQLDRVLEVLEELGQDGVEEPLHLPRYQACQIEALDSTTHLTGDDDWRRLAEGLRDFTSLTPVVPPVGLDANLRPYQHEGVTWLNFLREHGLHGILADDMGLGKTVQALALLMLEKEAGRLDRPSLIVVPTSLVFNWEAEAGRFTPALRVLPLHGTGRKRHFDEIDGADLILTTYALLRWDREVLMDRDYHYVILDEAQAIKNDRTQVAQLVRHLRARHRLTMTGTPMENHLGELWSQFAFLMPGFLDTRKRFTELFRNPIERGEPGSERAELASDRLVRRLRPFILRRTKQEVALDLPPKSEIPLYSELTGEQRTLYETVRLAYLEKVRREVESRGVERAQITILDALLRLRQICCHPQLLHLEIAKTVHTSAKMRQLAELIPEAVEEGRRILVFSQFVRFLTLVRHWLEQHRLDYCYLDGATRQRRPVVDRFQSGEVPLFLISLQAGGSGLNLTAADTVIHLDPWWNPAVMDQATDRAHRIGQNKPVQVYNLITRGTVEERILQLQARKQRLVTNVLTATPEGGHQITRADLDVLFEPLE